MKKMRWQILILVLALVAIGVLLIGQQPELLPSAPEINPSAGGVYSEGLIGSFGRLNPVLDFHHQADRDVNRLLYSSLLRFDDRGLPVHDLVESMGISRDGRFYNFSIREDAVWHDGKPLTSEDIVFTVEMLRSPDLPIPEDIRSLWETVEVEALDEHTLQFRLPEPYSPFLDYLTFGILPKHLLEDIPPSELVDAEFNIKPVGSGPYQFESLLMNGDQISGVVLKPFEDYYGERAFIEDFIFRYYPDSQAAFTAYQEGEIQGISRIVNEVLPSALEAPNLNLYSGPIPLLSMVFLNLDNPEVPFLQDGSIRRALYMGLNRQQMIDDLMDSQAILAHGPIFPNSWAYYPGVEQVPYDPEGAIRMLREAGYTIPATGGSIRENEEGQSLEIELVYPDDPRYEPFAQAIASDWRAIGVGVKLNPTSYEKVVSDYLEPHAYQAALVDLNLSKTPDPDPYPFWHQAQITGGQNYAKWDDRQASEYLEQARVEVDIAERSRLYNNFQVRFASELPSLPLFYPVYNYAVDEQVQGITMGPLFDPSDRLATAPQWFLLTGQAPESTTDSPSESTPTP
jgi:peptide/nickel transport system substrate-binding protein